MALCFSLSNSWNNTNAVTCRGYIISVESIRHSLPPSKITMRRSTVNGNTVVEWIRIHFMWIVCLLARQMLIIWCFPPNNKYWSFHSDSVVDFNFSRAKRHKVIRATYSRRVFQILSNFVHQKGRNFFMQTQQNSIFFLFLWIFWHPRWWCRQFRWHSCNWCGTFQTFNNNWK